MTRNALANLIAKLCKKASDNKGSVKDAFESVKQDWDNAVTQYAELRPKDKVKVFAKVTADLSRHRGEVKHRTSRDLSRYFCHAFEILADHLCELHPDIKPVVDFAGFAEEESGCVVFDTLGWEMLGQWAKKKFDIKSRS